MIFHFLFTFNVTFTAGKDLFTPLHGVGEIKVFFFFFSSQTFFSILFYFIFIYLF